ncbi:MAG: bifunctional demethylmenaquinone methyltransferase/2-methoxy-6-polyprenyl-1,4-benzoquinol methylase UbiE [Gemmatimonadaceae bacterium]
MPTDVDDAVAARAAAAGGAGKRAYVRRMFDAIAPRYDLLNHLLSWNIDRGWRRRALSALGWGSRPGGVYLDLCAGTLDVGATLCSDPAFAGLVVGVDFAEQMLRAGRHKAPPSRLAPVAADALELPLRDGSVDGVVIAFGIRNLESLDAGLAEVRRVLKPGRKMVVLEFSTPRLAAVRAGYRLYFHHVLPLVGRVVSGHPTAYRYLPESVSHFPTREALAARITNAGLERVRWETLTLGIAALHIGEGAERRGAAMSRSA